MKKEQAKLYIEILDNLKRDLTEEGGKKDVSEIKEILKGYGSGVYTSDGDELIVIPSSALDVIFGTKKPYCIRCKYFIQCSMEKQEFYNNTKHSCKEYEEVFDE